MSIAEHPDRARVRAEPTPPVPRAPVIPITEVTVSPPGPDPTPVQAFFAITIAGSLCVRNIRLVTIPADPDRYLPPRLVMAMPRRPRSNDGRTEDQAFPVSSAARECLFESLRVSLAAAMGMRSWPCRVRVRLDRGRVASVAVVERGEVRP